MADTEYKRLIQAAHDKALFGLLAVVQRAMQDADKNIGEAQFGASSGAGRSALTAVRHFLRQDSNFFLRRVDALFRGYLDRAMETMYVDLRPGMRKLSANELSLIDDEVVNHQIEVGRLAQRMRDANEESIGRLNVIVAQLHGEHEARERENPFRPYLLARTLYEAINEIAGDEQKSKLLFEHLANAMIQHLPGYYEAIRGVFEASGVSGRFVAQRSRAAHHQRYFGAPGSDAPGLPPNLGERVMPGLQRILETLQNISVQGGPAHPVRGGELPSNVQDFIRNMMSPPTAGLLSAKGAADRTRLPSARTKDGQAGSHNPLIQQLDRFQKNPGPAAGAQPMRLTALREKLELGAASPMERMTVEVVAILFEFILEDEQISPALRQQIGRLQVPMLKAALLDPDLMHQENHPARRLLNRLGSAAAHAGSEPAASQVASEIERIAGKVVDEFATDTVVFEICLQEFETFMAGNLRKDHSGTAQAIEAVEAAEKFSVLLTNTTTALCDVLLPLNTDKRVSDFIIHVWPHVLVRAASEDAARSVAPDHADSLFARYRAVLPELLWSIQEKQDAHERTALIRILPDIVKRLRAALQMIDMEKDDAAPILDQLVEIHTQVLRATPRPGRKELPSLDELRLQFARLSVNWERASWVLTEPPQPRASVIEEVFARHAVAAELNLGLNSVASSLADREFLVQTYLLGTRVAFSSGKEGEAAQGQLVWISTHRSLYLFRRDADATLVLYSFAALLEALSEERIKPVEYAPVFERAVESLLFGAAGVREATV